MTASRNRQAVAKKTRKCSLCRRPVIAVGERLDGRKIACSDCPERRAAQPMGLPVALGEAFHQAEGPGRDDGVSGGGAVAMDNFYSGVSVINCLVDYFSIFWRATSQSSPEWTTSTSRRPRSHTPRTG